MTTTGLDVARTVFGALGGLMATKPKPTVAAAIPDQLAPLDLELLILQLRLADVVADAPELTSIATDVAGLLADASAIVTTDDMVSLAARVRNTSMWLVYAAGPMKAAVARAQPGLWIAPLASDIVKRAWAVKGWRADAVRKAWAGGPVEASWQRAETADRDLNTFICNQYVNGPAGIRGQLNDVAVRRTYLVNLKTQKTNTPLSGSPGPDDVNLGAVDAHGNWPLLSDLNTALGDAQTAFANAPNEPATFTAIQNLSLRVQRVALMINALTVDEEVAWVAGSLIGYGDLVTRLNGYHTELLAIIADLHQGFVDNGGPHQASASAALAEIVQRDTFVQDRDAAISHLDFQGKVETAAIGIAVVAAAAMAGAAGAAAGGAIVAAFGGEAGAMFAGSVAAEAFMFTVVSRSANFALYGDQALQQTSFWEDLLWNAAMTGGLRVLDLGFPRLFTQTAQETLAYRVALSSTRQVSLLAFGVVRQRIEAGAWPTLDQGARMALDQMIMVTVLHLGGGLIGTFTSRNSGLADGMDAGQVAQLDQGATNLDTQRAALLAGSVTEADLDPFSTAVATQFNAEVAAVEAVSAADADRPAALIHYEQLKGGAELLLAANGYEPALGNTGVDPSFRPKGPGEVTYTAEARAVIDTVYDTANNPGAVTETTEPGVLTGKGADGRTTVFLPAEQYTGPPARAEDFVPAEHAGQDEAATDDVTAAGLANLQAMCGARMKVANVLAAAGPENAGALLTLMGHPDFDPVANDTRFTKADLAALTRSDEARWFAANHSVALALKIKAAKSGRVSNAFGNGAIDLLRRADTAIRAAADGPALVAELEGLGKQDLIDRLTPAKPKAPRRATVTDANLGVDVTTPEWEAFYAIQLARNAKRAVPVSDAALRVRAQVDQAVEASKRGKFTSYSSARRLAIIDRVTALQAGGEYPSLQASGIRGLMVERMFIKGWRPGTKLAFLNGKIVSPTTTGCSIPDDVFDHNGQFGVEELKSDRVDQLSTVSAANAVADAYGADAAADRTNLTTGAYYRLRFVRTPPADMQTAIVNRLSSRSGLRPHEIVFGEQAPIPIPQN